MLKPDQSLISSLLTIISNKLSYFLLSLCFSAALFLQGASVPPDSHRFLWDANILLGICLWQWHKLGTWISLLCRGTDLNFRFTSRTSPGLCRVIGENVCFVGVFQVAKAVSHSLNNCVNCLPGQKDVDMALRSIGEASKKLLVENVRFFVSSL